MQHTSLPKPGDKDCKVFKQVLELARSDNPEQTISHFVEIIQELVSPAHIEFKPGKKSDATGDILLQTTHNFHGSIVISENPSLSDQQQETLKTAAAMLTMILENMEHRQTIYKLQENEEIFAAFMEYNPAYIFFKDKQLRTINLSRNYEQMLGRPLVELLGKNLYEFFPAEMAEYMTKDDKRTLREGKPTQLEEELNGRHYSTFKIPIKIAGRPDRLAGFSIDITGQKLAEQALREAKTIAEENETRFKALHNASFGGIVIHDKGKILDCNQGLADISGYSPDELIGMDGVLLIAEKARDEVISKIRAGCEKPYESTGRRKNGEEFPLRLEAREIPYRGKRVRTTEFRDITSDKQAEQRLAAEKEQLAVTLRSIGDGVITTDTNGNVVLMNKIAEELTGWSQEEARGKALADVFKIIHEITRKPCEDPVSKVIASGKIVELANHTVLVARDGCERIITDSGAPIKDAAGAIIGVVLVFRDTTEKQKFLDTLQRTDKLEAIGVLAGGIAHDFNNLLSGIFGFIELARMTTDAAMIKKYLGQALIVFERAKNLTRQLLAFSRGGAPMLAPGNLGPLISESAQFALSGSNVTCQTNIADDLWPAEFDKGQIEQVVDNLVINAQQAMPTGGKIVIDAHNTRIRDGEHPLLKTGNYIKISVKDTGIGIPADIIQRTFDPFFTTKQKGNGLGLTTCYAIIQKHAGTIDVESVVGKGSSFHVFIPATQIQLIKQVENGPTTYSGKGNILIMDDEEFVRKVISKMLQNTGYSVIEARNGEEALKILTASAEPNIDAAIFDLTIAGGMGGKEAIIQVRKKFPNLPVIVSSGYSDDPVMAQPKEYGFTDSLGKPYSNASLAKMLNLHLKKKTD